MSLCFIKMLFGFLGTITIVFGSNKNKSHQSQIIAIDVNRCS